MADFIKKIRRNFSKITPKFFGKAVSAIIILLGVIFLFLAFEIYVPVNPVSHETTIYTVQKGYGDNEIAGDLQKLGLIRSAGLFKFYTIVSFQHSELKAGKYILSPRMSIYDIAKKMAKGDVISEKVTIFEGWDIRDMAQFFESKGVCKKDEFIQLANKDYSSEFDFLKDKPKGASLEGFLFPDTYQISENGDCQEIIITMLSNFEKKLTSDLKTEIAKQKKSVYDVVTMASLIEKEVKTMTDKKIVSGILWKRLSVGMPLQLDCTINYITNGNDPSVSIRNTKIDSPYNTYKYKGLPKGPICSPGINSIIAALNPTKTAYWFYLSDGRTIYAKTGEEQAANKAKYLH